jgi:FdhD protein
MMPKVTSARPAVVDKVRRLSRNLDHDLVVVEEPLEIRLALARGGKKTERSLSITMRTPGDDFELAVGFLFGEGIIHGRQDLEAIFPSQATPENCNVVTVKLRKGLNVDRSRLLRHFYTTSSCGVCGKASLAALQVRGCSALDANRPVVREEVIHSLPRELLRAQSLFERTGGLHAAALFDTAGSLVCTREDVGRHNAVDKLVGTQILAGQTPLSESILMVSGRTSFEIIQKALMAGVPVVAAVSAPSSLAVDLANKFGMTLLGFVRGESFNVYAGSQRIRP